MRVHVLAKNVWQFHCVLKFIYVFNLCAKVVTGSRNQCARQSLCFAGAAEFHHPGPTRRMEYVIKIRWFRRQSNRAKENGVVSFEKRRATTWCLCYDAAGYCSCSLLFRFFMFVLFRRRCSDKKKTQGTFMRHDYTARLSSSHLAFWLLQPTRGQIVYLEVAVCICRNTRAERDKYRCGRKWRNSSSAKQYATTQQKKKQNNNIASLEETGQMPPPPPSDFLVIFGSVRDR